MKTRQEIKALSKAAFAEQRGSGIFVVVLFFAVSLGVGLVGGLLSQFLMGALAVSDAMFLEGFLIGFLTTFIPTLFITYPLSVNMYGMFIKTYNKEKVSAGEMFSTFSVNYLRKVGGMTLYILYVILWSILLIVPGIIKALAYYFTPFILASCPNVTAKDSLKLSDKITNGHKVELFVLILSFIPWILLGLLTCGILLVVYVIPYMYTTIAGYYIELRDNAIAKGVVDPAEFGMKADA